MGDEYSAELPETENPRGSPLSLSLEKNNLFFSKVINTCRKDNTKVGFRRHSGAGITFCLVVRDAFAASRKRRILPLMELGARPAKQPSTREFDLPEADFWRDRTCSRR